MLTLDENHQYWKDEDGKRVRVPGVTEILQSTGIIETEFFTEEGRKRGTYVHLAAQYEDEGDLDEASIDPAILGYLEAYRAWKRLTDWRIQSCETMLMSNKYPFAGTVDRICTVGPALAALDLKSGAPQLWHRLQTAAYAFMVHPMAHRATLYLRDDGTFRFVEHERFGFTDYQVFIAALNIHNWRNNAK